MSSTDDFDGASGDLDDIFKNLAEEVGQDEQERAHNRGRSGGSRSYEVIRWAGIPDPKTDPKKVLIFRALGSNPDFNLRGIMNTKRTANDARIVQLAEVLNDKGKKMRLILPIEGHDDNHFLWRIINRVLEADWVKEPDPTTGGEKNVRKYRWLEKYPTMVGQVLYSNLLAENPQRKNGLLGKGWMGKQFFLMNVISRMDYKWHQENKHTAILSKGVRTIKADDGKILEFADPGVPAYGLTTALASNIMAFYGFWENYDIGIKRTGLTSPPMNLFNASKNPEMILDVEQRKLASTHVGLTEEEKTWERYDLDKLFKITSATKFLNNFKNFIAIVDANLGTSFTKELTQLSEKEKAEWDAEDKANNPDSVGEDASSEEKAEPELPAKEEAKAPEPTPAVIAETRSEVDIKFQLPGWDKLTKEDRGMIDSASKEGEEWSIKYKEGVRARTLCIQCDTRLPVSFKHCPACGEAQEVPNF